VKGLGRGGIRLRGFGISLFFFRSRIFSGCRSYSYAAGYSMMLQMACSNTLSRHGSDQLRGRVMSVYSMMFMACSHRSLFGGALAHRLGALSPSR